MRWVTALLVLLAAAPAAAQTVITSAAPESVDVTVYRAPGRNPGTPFDLDWLEGYALISETRRVELPAGETEIRFEGVAGGIVPQSAIVTGFPDGIVERNRDAYLLSPATLVDRSLGRRVSLRRTSLATGAVREMEAVIRSGADGAVVLQTSEGYEALRCTGLSETLIADSVPPGLSARPTLSVRVRSSRPLTATVTLAYLASGFDWQANYIATLSEDGRTADLFAWLTLASNDETSFANADAQAVAGRLNRDPVAPQPREGGPLQLRCWPQGRTSDIPLERWQRSRPPPAPPAGVIADGENIIVTGSRVERRSLDSSAPISVIIAEQEALGDLKLYRIPEPVTVAANSQKQVALLRQPEVRVELVYRQRLIPGRAGDAGAAERVLVTRNRTAEGLGLPLPGGRLVLFAPFEARQILIGEGALNDLAVGEDVEIWLGEAPGVRTATELVRETDDWNEYELTVTNDRPAPVRFEAEFEANELRRRGGPRLPRRDGRPLWAVTVPANGSVTLRYRVPADD